ncbi:RNA polymerase sigma factor (sigma-70 family) [Thermonema lapsum]|uniref:RNA polymerase sigma factor (Sigma-70 family) n=1 Tax=Thermonema lapsum TaxID=28195 RepID=A0A846MMP1_9BACT|nr:sigma-70 family RNA polymerase sigma factor [Thermonema lapsum]NIK72637.1 RNA polymerase sigma factor (sigma-70 family) [Thermonema lapsum]
MKDEEILKRLKNGDESALQYLYKKHYRMMSRLVLKNSGTEEEARDIFQEALIVLWQKVRAGNFMLTSKLSTYLYSVCQNLWRKELERKRRLSSEEKDDIVEQNWEEKERIELVRRCLKQLGDTCQKVLTFYYFDRMNMKEIAEQLGFASADVAKSKKYKCMQELERIVRANFKKSDLI